MADTKRFDYRYPLSKLTSSDDYLKITVLEYKPPGIVPEGGKSGFALPTAGEVSGYGTEQEKGTIILPIPDEVQDKNVAVWGGNEINLATAAIAGGLTELIGSGPKSLADQIKGGVEAAIKASTYGSTQKAIGAYTIGKSLNVLLGQRDNTTGLVGRAAGIIANSNVELIFSSVKIREPFSFAFDIVPRSQKEAQQVKEIIKTFKKHSAAKKSIGQGLFLKAPEVFKLEYMNGGKSHPYLNRFKICALQSMSVNYTPSNTYATYTDGAPVNMTLGLSFQELTPIFAEDYDEGIGTEGTGY